MAVVALVGFAATYLLQQNRKAEAAAAEAEAAEVVSAPFPSPPPRPPTRPEPSRGAPLPARRVRRALHGAEGPAGAPDRDGVRARGCLLRGRLTARRLGRVSRKAGGRGRRGLDLMRAGRNLRRRQAGGGGDDGGPGPGAADEEDEFEDFHTKKGARKAARRAARQHERDAWDAKQEREEARRQQRADKDAEREERERLEAEERQKAEEEKQRLEDEEAAKWMHMMSVEQDGSGEADVRQEDQGLLQRFVDFIKERKTVLLEELAAEFDLRVPDVINRVQGLEQMGRITGVMDDRGKFIYISSEEMAAVADFIQKKGRVSIAELAKRSNELITL